MPLADQINSLLPQTQCGQCSYGGCKPYAEAIANQGENINRCPPGGVKTLQALGELLQRDITPFLSEMQQQEKDPQLAVIRESECIGCTKCIQACPVDAIIGAAKQLHTIIVNECTGCELCIAPCPVDCIDLIAVEKLRYQPKKAKQRYNSKLQRKEKPVKISTEKNNIDLVQQNHPLDRKAYIQAALQRVKEKKSQSRDRQGALDRKLP